MTSWQKCLLFFVVHTKIKYKKSQCQWTIIKRDNQKINEQRFSKKAQPTNSWYLLNSRAFSAAETSVTVPLGTWKKQKPNQTDAMTGRQIINTDTHTHAYTEAHMHTQSHTQMHQSKAMSHPTQTSSGWNTDSNFITLHHHKTACITLGQNKIQGWMRGCHFFPNYCNT